MDPSGMESLLAAFASRVLSSTVPLVAHVFIFASCTSSSPAAVWLAWSADIGPSHDSMKGIAGLPYAGMGAL